MKKGDFVFSSGKKGMSTIIVTLILVLLSIVLIGIIWAVISNIANSSLQQISAEQKCTSSGVEVASFSCTQTGSECNVTVRRTSGSDDLGGVRLIFANSNGDSGTSDSPGNIITLSTKKMTAYNLGISNITKVSAAIYFNDTSGKAIPCSITSSELVGTFGSDGIISGGGGSTGGGSYTGGSSGGSTGGGTCSLTSSCDSLCGSSGSGYSNDGGATCYSDSSCTSSCGSSGTLCTSDADCGTGFTCNTNTGACQCVPADLSNYCSQNNYQCGAVTAQNGTCGNVAINCGLPLCSFNSGCPTPQYCELASHTCKNPIIVNSGSVYSAWPQGAPRFFDSNDLPKTPENISAVLTSNPNPNGEPYVMFPGSNDNNCTPIYLIQYSPTNGRSYAYLYFQSPSDFANISANDNYEIWNTQYGCLNASGQPYPTCS